MSRLYRTAVLSLSLILAACATGAPAAEQTTPEALFERALTALHKEDWTEAIAAFDRFALSYPTHPRIQEARFYLANAHFGKKEYVTAANEYARLASDYPAGPWADDSRFKVCESYYRLSPKPQLDQQNTRAAFDHCQSLLTYYPTSEFVPKAQEMISDLRKKLADKSFMTGEFYYKRGAYDSAIIYFDATLHDYPDTAVAPRALHRLFETYQKLGYKEEAETTRQRLLKDYPTSAEAKLLQEPATTTGT
jgi:outer membrane protein assembly factor BamD